MPIFISSIWLLGCTALFGQTTNNKLAPGAPEQIWDRRETPGPEFRLGEGTGSATPLAWSMAQFVRLAIDFQLGHNSETPAVVAARYAKRQGDR